MRHAEEEEDPPSRCALCSDLDCCCFVTAIAVLGLAFLLVLVYTLLILPSL